MTDPTNDAPVTVEQQDRQLFSRLFGVLPSASPMDQRALRDIARHRLAALASAPAESEAVAFVRRVSEMVGDELDAHASTELRDAARKVMASAPAGDGVDEALTFALTVKAELMERAPTYGIRSIEREHFDRAILAIAALARPRAAVGEPVAYQHTLHMEGGQNATRLTEQQESPFGLPGRDYSEEYTVTTTPLYALQSPPAKVEQDPPCTCERARARGITMMCLSCDKGKR